MDPLGAYELRVEAKQCVCCGICMDVCQPGAMGMRRWNSRTVEGAHLSYLRLRTKRNPEIPPAGMMTFPYLARPERCDGCMDCVQECPVTALSLTLRNRMGESTPRGVVPGLDSQVA